MAVKKQTNGERPDKSVTDKHVNEETGDLTGNMHDLSRQTDNPPTHDDGSVVVNDMLPEPGDTSVEPNVHAAAVETERDSNEYTQDLVFHPEPSPELVRKHEAKEKLNKMGAKEVKALKGEFPSLEGENDLEVARRCPDQHEKRSDVYRKVFVIQGKAFADEDWFHRRQYNALRQEAINSGVRLTGDAYFVGAEPHGDGVSLNLVYECPAIPAVVATGFAAHAPADPKKVEGMKEQMKEAEQTGDNPRETK